MIQSGLLDKIHYQTIFSIGYVNYFNLSDSTASKPFFNELLDSNNANLTEYVNFISRFYADSSFIVVDSIIFDQVADEDSVTNGSREDQIEEVLYKMQNGNSDGFSSNAEKDTQIDFFDDRSQNDGKRD